MTKEQIEKELLQGWVEPDGELQEQAILKAIKDIGDNESEAGVFGGFMIELGDFLLAYNKLT